MCSILGHLLFQVRHTHKKRGASSVPGPRCKGSRIALIVEPSNAESPTPMYIKRTAKDGRSYYYTSKGRSRCFGLDKQLEFARFLDRQTQSVQKTPLYVCVPPYVITQGLSAFRKDTAKIHIIL